jgi:hypothetical protein
MKHRYKKLFSVLGAISLVTPFIGCEADAEESADGNTNGAVSATASATVSAGEGKADTAATGATNATAAVANADASTRISDDDTGTNSVATAGTTNITNQQTTIIQRIPPTIPADVKLSKGVQEVVKLLQSGVSETVVLLFIEKSTDSFELDAPDIVYLNDIGVQPTVLAAMLNHDGADPDVLHDALGTNNVAVATAPPAAIQTNVGAGITQAAPQIEVSSNYVAGPQYGGTPSVPVTDPNAQPQQQQVVVEQQPAVVVTQPAVTYSYFYDSLSPYGSWVYVTDYGWCWQPTIAVTHHGWRPYAHGGQWLYSDVGWYWHSDYSWGWAPFHYGRWYCSPRVGWVWTPDYTWGPSWVTWRRTGDYCGWAPLPPRCYVRPGIGFSYWGRNVGFNFSFGYSHDYYTFVPTGRFCDRRIIDHVVPTDRTRPIYRNSTVVNNYIVGNNNTIINNGVGRDYVATHTRSEIPRVRVQDAAAATTTGRVQPDRLVRNGAETVVYRPQRPAPTLVQAHEAAVSRTRSETARALGNSAPNTGGEMRRNMITSRSDATARPDSAVSPSSGSSAIRPTSPRAATGGTVPTRSTETARTRLASRGDAEVTAPVFGTPAPIRPEPDRSAEILRARTAQENRVRPSTTTSTTGNSTTPGRSTVPRFERGQTATGTAQVPAGSTRPGAPLVSTQPSAPAARSEISRGNLSADRSSATLNTPVRPATRAGSEVGAQARTETTRPSTVQPAGRPPLTANTPAQSPTFTRPSPSVTTTPSRLSESPAASPQVVRPSQPTAQSPAFSRPAPSAAQPAAPVTRSVPNNTPAASPSFRQPTIQQNNNVQPPAAASQPRAIQRSESFSRPSMPVQRSAPQPSVVRPQSVAPVPSASQRPAMIREQPSRPTYSPPPNPQRSAPSAGSAPINGGSFRSAPPSAAPSRSVGSSPERSPSGRGRVEIGR